MSDRAGNAALAERYDRVAYAAQSNALSHPDHMAAVATLFGLEPPAVSGCRVLELGCSDGANLLPMAAALPGAEFVGCDLSQRAIEAARRGASELGLANATLLQQDLRELPAELGAFDYMIAHGLYSWVPAAIRDALLQFAAQRLTPNGVLFISYNVYPGCHVRQAAWEVLRFHTDSIADPKTRLSSARTLAAVLAEPGATQDETDALLRKEFGHMAQESDSALFHDDLAAINDPVYFHQFVAHAERHQLKFVAEAKLSMMSTVGVSARAQQLLTGLDRLKREQYLDFARMRRFRQSLLCRAESTTGFALAPERIAGMHASAATAFLRALAEAKLAPISDAGGGASARAMLQWLAEISPRAASVDEIKARFGDRAEPNRTAGGTATMEAMLAHATVAGFVELHVHPPTLASVVGERPTAAPVVRWQAARQSRVTNLRHETITLKDPTALRLLALLDGSRTRAELAAGAGITGVEDGRVAGEDRVDEYLKQFALHALLVG